MPSLVTDYIKGNWQYFEKIDKDKFIEEVTDALKKHHSGLMIYKLGDKFDVEMYENFLKWMEEQEEKVTSETTKGTKNNEG